VSHFIKDLSSERPSVLVLLNVGAFPGDGNSLTG
jgi:hypothetical protein